MDGSLNIAPATPERHRGNSPHLICGFRVRGLAVAGVCLYLAYISYIAVRDQDFQWEHELWTVITWAVWLLLLGGLISEVRCRRERLLLLLLFANCLLGVVGSVWTSFPFAMLRRAREVSLVLWVMASVVALSAITVNRNGRTTLPKTNSSGM